MISETKPVKIKSSLSFNFAITKTCAAIRLAEGGTRMSGIQFQLFPSKLSNLPTNFFRQKVLLYKNHSIDLHFKSIGFKLDLLNRLPGNYYLFLCVILIITAV